MGCLPLLVAIVFPRFVMVVLWLFTNYLSRAYGTWIWPLIGFFVLPTTTLAYAIAQNAFHGVRGGGLALVVIGVIVDFGLIGGGRGVAKRFRRDRRWR
jgi:hypothetical protein